MLTCIPQGYVIQLLLSMPRSRVSSITTSWQKMHVSSSTWAREVCEIYTSHTCTWYVRSCEAVLTMYAPASKSSVEGMSTELTSLAKDHTMVLQPFRELQDLLVVLFLRNLSTHPLPKIQGIESRLTR